MQTEWEQEEVLSQDGHGGFGSNELGV